MKKKYKQPNNSSEQLIIINKDLVDNVNSNSIIDITAQNLNSKDISLSNISNKKVINPPKCKSLKFLPPKTNKLKKTLILDLDETLIHSIFDSNSKEHCDLQLNFLINGQKILVKTKIRPYVDIFLEKMSKKFEIIIFSAGISEYVNPIINILNKNNYIEYKLFREHCSILDIGYTKDLIRLNRNLKDIIILDNNPISYIFNIENGIPIKSWTGEKKDNELLNLIPILEFLSEVDDVRKYIKIFSNGQIFFYEKAYKIIEEKKKVNEENIEMKRKRDYYFNDKIKNKMLDEISKDYKRDRKFTEEKWDKKNSVVKLLESLNKKKYNNNKHIENYKKNFSIIKDREKENNNINNIKINNYNTLDNNLNTNSFREKIMNNKTFSIKSKENLNKINLNKNIENDLKFNENKDRKIKIFKSNYQKINQFIEDNNKNYNKYDSNINLKPVIIIDKKKTDLFKNYNNNKINKNIINYTQYDDINYNEIRTNNFNKNNKIKEYKLFNSINLNENGFIKKNLMKYFNKKL